MTRSSRSHSLVVALALVAAALVAPAQAAKEDPVQLLGQARSRLDRGDPAALDALTLEVGRPLRWDPAEERFENDPAANALRRREARNDWQRA